MAHNADSINFKRLIKIACQLETLSREVALLKAVVMGRSCPVSDSVSDSDLDPDSYNQILFSAPVQEQLISALEELVHTGLIVYKFDFSFIWHLLEGYKLPMKNGKSLDVESFCELICLCDISPDKIPSEKTVRNNSFSGIKTANYHKSGDARSTYDYHLLVLANGFFKLFPVGISGELAI